MNSQQKTITVYLSTDGKEFTSESECKKHELFLVVSDLHRKLYFLKFYHRFKAVDKRKDSPVEITPCASFDLRMGQNGMYYIEHVGRMGNCNGYVNVSVSSKWVKLIYHYPDNGDSYDYYLGRYPLSWATLNDVELSMEVEKFLSQQMVYKRVVKTIQTETWELI